MILITSVQYSTVVVVIAIWVGTNGQMRIEALEKPNTALHASMYCLSVGRHKDGNKLPGIINSHSFSLHDSS